MKTILFIAFLLSGLTVSGTTYYVRSGGNDLNSGLSDAEAWANHPWMSTWKGIRILRPGDTVLMKRDNTWSIAYPTSSFITVSQSGEAGKYIVTTAYGTGKKPILKISTDSQKAIIYGNAKSFIKFDNLDIQHWSSKKNLGAYYGIRLSDTHGICHDWIITNCDIHNCPSIGFYATPNAYNIIVGDTAAKVTASPMSYSNHIYDCGYAGVAIHGCNYDGNSYNYVCYNYIHDINIDGEDRDISYGISFSPQGGSNNSPKYCYARFNYIANIPSWVGIDTHGSSYTYFQDNYLYNCKLNFGCQSTDYTSNPILDNIYIERNIAENPTNFKFSTCYFLEIRGVSSDKKATNIYIRDNKYFFTERPIESSISFGIKLSNVDGVLIEGNYIYNGPPGLTNGAINMVIGAKNVIIKGNYINDWAPGILFTPTAFGGNINILNNIIHTHEAGIWSSTSGNITGNLNIANNTLIIKNTGSYQIPLRFYMMTIPYGISLKIRNNVIGFSKPTSSGRYINSPSTISGYLQIDYNLYWNSTRSDPFYSEAPLTWDAWNKRGYDIHGIKNTDPLFRNISGSFSYDIDFELQSNSPAIDKGTDVSLTSDYAGAPLCGVPDIGAFEFQKIVIPVYVGSAIQNSTPSILEITYNYTLANSVPASSSYSVKVNSVTRTVNSVAISGTKVRLTLSSPVKYGDVVTVAYTKPSTNPIKTESGGEAESFTAKSVKNNVLPPAPVFQSAVVQNAAPSVIEMTWDLSLANIVPSASAFTVMVNSVKRSVSSVAIASGKVRLTLASAVKYGDIVTVAYTKPSTYPLQTEDGGQAASFSAKPVTNNVNPPVPVFSSAVIQNDNPSLIEITFNVTLANIVPAASAFNVQVNSTQRTVSAVAIVSGKVRLTLSSSVVFGDVATVAYTKPSTNPLQSVYSIQVASFTAKSVKNNVGPVVPVFQSAVVENSEPSVIVMTYDINLANIVPVTTAFNVKVNSTFRSVSTVAIVSGKVRLTLSTPVVFNDIVTIAYTKPSTNPLQTTTGGQASSLTAQPVSNNVERVNQLPEITISNPTKGFKYNAPANVVIDAVATDPDGTIIKVEFFNGNEKLAELTTPPWSYTWKDVDAGTYSLTAVATDNMNATTVSPPVDIIVEADVFYDAESEIFNLYPNPNDGNFSINLVEPLQDEKSEITIVSSDGKSIHKELLLPQEIIKQFNLSHIKSGIYILMLAGKEIIVTKKFIRE